MYTLRGKIANVTPLTLDKTLTLEGSSADAKAVGEAIAEAKRIAREHDEAHANLKNNPHNVTVEQLGLENVDNTSDMDKPVSNAQATAIAEAKKTGTDAEKTAKTYTNEQVKKARPYNLLKNSNFADPVNTKGEVSYKGAVEGIDRWEMTVPQWMVSVEDGCIKVSDNPDNSTTKVGMLRQTIDVTPNLRGKTVTFVAKIKGNGMTRMNINNTSIGDYTAYDADGVNYGNEVWHIRSLVGVIPADASTFYVALQSRNMETWYCEWVALYEGEYTADTLPEYQPKGYMVEALDCGVLGNHLDNHVEDKNNPHGVTATQISAAASFSAIDDCDDAKGYGKYRITTNTANTPSGCAKNGNVLLVAPWDANSGMQILLAVNGRKVFFRAFASGTFTSWDEHLTTGNAFKKVWENASPSSAFDEQTISLNLSPFRFVMIEYGALGEAIPNHEIICTGTSTRIRTFFEENGKILYQFREVLANSDSIYFGVGKYFQTNMVDSYDSVKPLRIYGIL